MVTNEGRCGGHTHLLQCRGCDDLIYKEVLKAARVIYPAVIVAPLVRSEWLSSAAAGSVHLQLECHQVIAPCTVGLQSVTKHVVKARTCSHAGHAPCASCPCRSQALLKPEAQLIRWDISSIACKMLRNTTLQVIKDHFLHSMLNRRNAGVFFGGESIVSRDCHELNWQPCPGCHARLYSFASNKVWLCLRDFACGLMCSAGVRCVLTPYKKPSHERKPLNEAPQT